MLQLKYKWNHNGNVTTLWVGCTPQPNQSNKQTNTRQTTIHAQQMPVRLDRRTRNGHQVLPDGRRLQVEFLADLMLAVETGAKVSQNNSNSVHGTWGGEDDVLLGNTVEHAEVSDHKTEGPLHGDMQRRHGVVEWLLKEWCWHVCA